MTAPPFRRRHLPIRSTPEAALGDALATGTGWCTASVPSTVPPLTATEILAMMEAAKRAAIDLTGVTRVQGFDPGSPEGDFSAYGFAHAQRDAQHRNNERLAEHLAAFNGRGRTHTLSYFLCPRCGAKSFNPHDIQRRYCGRCHVFVDDEIRRDLGREDLPLAERVDGDAITRDVLMLPMPDPLPLPEVPLIRGELGRVEGVTLIRQRTRQARDLWWANYEAELVTRIQLRWLRTQHDPVAVQAHLETLLRLRADATRHPGKLPIDDFWRWREACLRSRRDAALVGMPRGGFHPTPVRWVCLTWCEREPRRSRMLGLLAPWDFGRPSGDLAS